MTDSDTPVAAVTIPAPRQRPARPTNAPAPPPTGPGERRHFDVVMRGYERAAVDGYFVRCSEELTALRRDLADSERRRQLAEQHATATESEIRSVRAEQQYSPATPAEESFGFRAEKLLRLAEQEAADVRGNAAREASALVEQARAEAERHRHEVEQTLIARSAVLDQQASQRTVELQEREQQIAGQFAATRAEAERLHESARQAADQHRAQAAAEAESVRAAAATDARRMREQAGQEVARLAGLQSDTRAELVRLAGLLADELGHARPGAHRGAGDDGAAGPATASEAVGAVDRRARLVVPAVGR